MVDTNKKLPEHAWDTEEVVPKYGTIYGFQGILGEHKFVFSNPAEPENYSYQEVDASGTYKTLQKSKEKVEIQTCLDVGEKRSYCAGGTSNHCDGNVDQKNMSTSRKDTVGDDGESIGGKKFVTHVQGQYRVAGSADANFVLDSQQASPLSKTKSFFATDGDRIYEHDGDDNSAYTGDYVQAVTGNKISMVEKGDYAVHVQKGNYDCHVAANGRIYTDKDLLIESGTKITLKVGGSTIEITPSNITIKSARIDLNP